MALQTPEEDLENNPSQADYESKFENLNKAEKTGNFSDTAKSATNADDINNNEKDYENYVAGIVSKTEKITSRFGIFKKSGPLATIIITTLLGGVGISGLMSPLLLTQSITGNALKFNTQETSLTLRSNRLIASKMSGEATKGLCQPITILCKFTRPSNRFLKQLEKNGIRAFDEADNLIEKKLIFPNTRPKSYKFINKAGKETVVDAKSLYSTILTDSEFRAAFHKASNTRFMSVADKIFDSIKLRFSFSTTNKLAGVVDDASLVSKLDDAVVVDDSLAKTALTKIGEAGGDVAKAATVGEDAVEKILNSEIDINVGKVAKAGKGSLIGLAAGIGCMAGDVPGLIVKANRSFQTMQIIKYATVFLAIFGAIKAGDATTEQSSAVGEVLTETVDGKSAMDSNGMQYLISGQMGTSNDNFKKFTPGISILSLLAPVLSVTSSKIKTQACAAATNPATGVAIDTALAANAGETLGVSLGLALANVAFGFVLAKVVEKVLPPILKEAAKHIPTKEILGFFFGDLTKKLAGEPVGDALVSGILHLLAQTANLGGNMALTVMQAISYEKATKEVQLAYAEEDRATLSPFDTSSPNTMMGSFVQKLVPYYASSSSISGSITNTLSSIGKIVMSSFGMALQPLTAGAESVDVSQYQQCDDPTIKDIDVAAGPFCNIIYGVPTQYLDKDPVLVVNELIASGDIDPETGEPKPDDVAKDIKDWTVDFRESPDQKRSLWAWMAMCTDGRIDDAADCQIKDAKTANFALYTIDHRIQVSMDEE